MAELPIIDGEEAAADEVTPFIVMRCTLHPAWEDCGAIYASCQREAVRLPVPTVGTYNTRAPVVRHG